MTGKVSHFLKARLVELVRHFHQYSNCMLLFKSLAGLLGEMVPLLHLGGTLSEAQEVMAEVVAHSLCMRFEYLCAVNLFLETGPELVRGSPWPCQLFSTVASLSFIFTTELSPPIHFVGYIAVI